MSPRFLLDTDWVIDHFNGIAAITRRLEELRPAGLALSVISLAELYEGVHYSRDPARSGRERAGAAAHERRDMGLFDAEDLARSCLREPAVLEETVDLQREIGLELFALRMRESEIAKDVAGAVLHPGPAGLLGHHGVCLSR